MNQDCCVTLYFCRQRLKCGVAQITVSSQMETIGLAQNVCINGQV